MTETEKATENETESEHESVEEGKGKVGVTRRKRVTCVKKRWRTIAGKKPAVLKKEWKRNECGFLNG